MIMGSIQTSRIKQIDPSLDLGFVLIEVESSRAGV